jgi:aryl-alcohol dehydrogenase-like predicted oxidoreductase
MQYRSLGRSGLKVSPLALGTWNFGDPTPAAEAIRMVQRALDAGINLIDTADMYARGESERIVGQALKGRREKVILATKCYFPTGEGPNDRGNSRKHIYDALHASLERLDTDYIDLYQLHRPDFDTPLEETLRALDDLARQGKIRYIGTSTFPAWYLMEALTTAERLNTIRPVSEQPPYNLLDRRIENELVPLAQRHGVGLITWSPLANGVLAGRYGDVNQPPDGSRVTRVSYVGERINQRGVEVGEAVAELARRRGISPSQLTLMWTKDQPGVTAPLLGSRTFEQLEEALPVLEMSLNVETAAEMDSLVPPGSVVADYFNTSGWMKMKIVS